MVATHRRFSDDMYQLQLLVLDSEAVSALARPERAQIRHQRVRAAMRSAHDGNAPVRIPSAVLIEL